MTIKGRRVYAREDGLLPLQEGDYGFDPAANRWYARPPGCHMGDLSNHEIVEHEDGTITVSPSILITYGDENGQHQWHGYLEHGEWRTA